MTFFCLLSTPRSRMENLGPIAITQPHIPLLHDLAVHGNMQVPVQIQSRQKLVDGDGFGQNDPKLPTICLRDLVAERTIESNLQCHKQFTPLNAQIIGDPAQTTVFQ